MRIAFDLRRMGQVGVGRYMQCLLDALTCEAPRHDYIFIMAPDTEHLLSCARQGTVVRSSAKYYSVAEQVAIPRILKAHKVDLFHALHFVVPLVKVCPTIVTIHDAIHLVYPQDLPSWAGRVYARWMMEAAVQIADRVLTVSEHSKRDLVKYLHIAPDQITVTHAAVDARFHAIVDEERIMAMRSRLGIAGDYVLYAGIFKQRKNHAGLLEAIAVLLSSGVCVHLVISGPPGAGEQEVRAKARELGINKQVLFTGLVSEDDLPCLYSGARVYVSPSLYEGFGLTVVEAMACGTPVVCHDGTSFPEVCGDAALYANASKAKELATQICRALHDERLRISLIQKGYANVARFSSRKMAQQTLQVYEGLIAGQSPKERKRRLWGTA